MIVEGNQTLAIAQLRNIDFFMGILACTTMYIL